MMVYSEIVSAVQITEQTYGGRTGNEIKLNTQKQFNK